ncbi:MAG: hypothetical protein IBX72_03825 [Nitrospirae bacterium]|jgi:cytochrome c553|nr:hypothetical protein [Nitrospirota bacterium]
MKSVRIALLSVIAIGLIFSYTFAAGDAEKGKSLFNDPKFAGGTKACNECHPGGRGLEKSGMKKEFNMGGKKQLGLEEAVNYCIVKANKGEAIDPKSEDMANIIAYIKSLKAEMPKRRGY